MLEQQNSRFRRMSLLAILVIFAASIPFIVSSGFGTRFSDLFNMPKRGLRPVATKEVMKSVYFIVHDFGPYICPSDRAESLTLNTDGYLLDSLGQMTMEPSVKDVTITVHGVVDVENILKKLDVVLGRVGRVSISDTSIEFWTAHSVDSITVTAVRGLERTALGRGDSGKVDEPSQITKLILRIFESVPQPT